VDSGVEEGGGISPFYDPMIAKIIVHAETRTAAAARLADACGKVEVWPVRTNAGFLVRCAANPDFVAGRIDTGFIAAHEATLIDRAPSPAVFAAAGRAMVADGPAPWAGSGFRLNAPPATSVLVEIDGARLDAHLGGDVGVVTTLPLPDGAVLFVAGVAKGQRLMVLEAMKMEHALAAPFDGTVERLAATTGDQVTEGAVLARLRPA
jgi:3-methylcrotonyl-CoA carboxylase alpha subunit